MHSRRPRQTPRRYCRSASPLTTLGIVMMALGTCLLICCIPEWAWAALTGFILIAAGLILIRLGRR